MFASWNEMITAVAPRAGMFVGRSKYTFVRCFVQGFGTGRGDDVLAGFQRWICGQPQHLAVNKYDWSSLILREVFDHGKCLRGLASQSESSRASSFADILVTMARITRPAIVAVRVAVNVAVFAAGGAMTIALVGPKVGVRAQSVGRRQCARHW